jgi:hypothetical protein
MRAHSERLGRMTRPAPHEYDHNEETSFRREPVESSLEKLRGFLDALMMTKRRPGEFADFERELHERVMEFERDVVGAEMLKLDVDVPSVLINGKVHQRVLRQSQRYMTAAGEVTVERWLYKDRTDGDGRCVSPMELTVGVVGGFWTPRAAQQALWVVSQMTPGKAEELFERVGNMEPSKSSIDRLPKEISTRWEDSRADFEQRLRAALVVPESAVSIAVSIDGVHAPFEQSEATRAREEAAAEGRLTKGPIGYREVGCATVSFCDDKGDLLGAIRLSRAPEYKKETLKEQLAAEIAAILKKRPELKLIKIADAWFDNWAFLTKRLPHGEELIDFFHASEKLHAAIAAVYGDGSLETQFRWGKLREALRDERDGAQKVMRALKHLVANHPRKQLVRSALFYFRKNHGRMRYAEMAAKGFPIGSGVVEAACKTLVTQRLKQSGMRWSNAGAQAILTPRGWDQSERFDEAWALVAATYNAEVTVLANVIAMKPKPEARRSRPSR